MMSTGGAVELSCGWMVIVSYLSFGRSTTILCGVGVTSVSSREMSMNCSSVAVSLARTNILLVVGCLSVTNLGDRSSTRCFRAWNCGGGSETGLVSGIDVDGNTGCFLN